MTTLVEREQDTIWDQDNKRPGTIIYLGTNTDTIQAQNSRPWVSDHRIYNEEITDVSVEIIICSLFYIELIGMPTFEENISFNAQVRCRLRASEPGYRLSTFDYTVLI